VVAAQQTAGVKSNGQNQCDRHNELPDTSGERLGGQPEITAETSNNDGSECNLENLSF
jgi:hypothetical protein